MPSGSADTQHLIEQVRSAAAGGPYVVREQPYGFDLTIDVADARSASLIRQQGLDRVVTHRVRVDEAAHALSITDVSHRVRWDEDADTNAGSNASSDSVSDSVSAHTAGLSLHPDRLDRSVRQARTHSRSFGEELGVGLAAEHPGAHPIASGEGRELVREAAETLGWHEQRGRDRRIALAFAGIAVAGLLVAGLIILVIKLSG